MAREKTPPPDNSGDVPVWFMTYSDVITLLMTFFILLLTFATDEPEKFERMQISLFGGGGASGIASKADSNLEQDSLVMRQRPRSSRITTRGSETSPIHADPEIQSLSNGLESLDKEPEHELSTSRSLRLPLNALVDQTGQLSGLGQALVSKFAENLRKAPFSVELQVGRPDDVPQAVSLAEALTASSRMPLGRVGVGVRLDDLDDPSQLRVVFSRLWNHDKK